MPKTKLKKARPGRYDIVPTTSYKHRQTLMGDYLDKALGQGSERALNAILAIAEGRCTMPEELDTQLERIDDPRLKAMYLQRAMPPDWNTRLAAYNLLMAYHQGRPRQQVEITTNSDAPQLDLAKYTHEEKVLLVELLTKGRSSERTVEGKAEKVSHAGGSDGKEKESSEDF